ncbi:MAG TPA: hypothetical protein VIJ93_00225, partial [bacterium]
LFLDVMALLLIVEWLSHLAPGAVLNPIRRVLFRLCLPFLKWSDHFFSVQSPFFNSRGLLTALLLIAIGRYGVPWLILLSYSLRG